MRSAGRSWLLLTGCVLFYVIYLLFGALVFSSIERPVEEKLTRDLEALKQELLNQSCVSAASLDLLLANVLKANKYGVSVFRNESSPSNWDLVSSMFFANTLVTTIGEFKNGANEGLEAPVASANTYNENAKGFFSVLFCFLSCLNPSQHKLSNFFWYKCCHVLQKSSCLFRSN